MEKPYAFSFVAGGLLLNETTAILQRYIQKHSQDLGSLREEIVSGALLHTTRASSRLRYFLEILHRLQRAYKFEIDWVAEEKEGSRQVLFALCCRYYEFVGDFMKEVVCDKIALGNLTLSNLDFYTFFEQKAEIHPELLKLTDSSRQKVRSVLYRMLSEAGMLDNRTRQIMVPAIPQALVQEYRKVGDYEALIHLLVQEELRK